MSFQGAMHSTCLKTLRSTPKSSLPASITRLYATAAAEAANPVPLEAKSTTSPDHPTEAAVSHPGEVATKTPVQDAPARKPTTRRAGIRRTTHASTRKGGTPGDAVTRASEGARSKGLVGRAAAVQEPKEAMEAGGILGSKMRVPFEAAREASQHYKPAPIVKRKETEKTPNRFFTAKDRYDVLNLFADSRIERDEAPVEVNASLKRDPRHQFSIPRRWLRDHCQCPKCIHPETKQRNIDIFEMKDECWDMTKCDIHESTVHITWKDGHESSYDLNWMRRAFCAVPTVSDRQGLTPIMQWDANNVTGPDVEVKYDDIMRSDRGVAELTRKIRRMGFCFIDSCPPTPEATQALLERIGPIRTTHYGGFYDFTSDLSSKDTAYTSEALDVHTDTNYFTDPAGLQMFHLLSHEGTGGETQLVDGFQVAHVMHRAYPKLYDVLSRQTMFFHASGNEGTSIQPARPVPTLEHDANEKYLSQVRWNNADRGAFVSTVDSAGMIGEWYKAAKRFDTFLKKKDPAYRTEFQLKPGRPLIFDNWRVLHGRSAFTGKRRMAGGYINRDDFISRYRTSNFGHEEVLKHGVY